MDGHENEKWGRYAERVARRVYSLTKDRSQHHDARDESGRPVEVKSCRVATGDRCDPGKFFICEGNHEKLVDEDGLYVFVLYDPQNLEYGPILHMEMKCASWVRDVSQRYEWTHNGIRRGETVIRPPWTVVFSSGVKATA